MTHRGWTYRVHKCWCGRPGFPSKFGVRCAKHAVEDEVLFASSDTQLDLERLASAILDEAEDTIGAKSLARARARSGEWPVPKTANDFLFWLEDEASRQEDMLDIESGPPESNMAARQAHAQVLRDVAQRLNELGFTASPAPWAEHPQNAVPV